MANFRYVTPNRLREEAGRDRRQLFLWGTPAVVFAFFLNPVFGILCLGIVLMFWNRTSIHLQGASGEERALGVPVRYPGSLADLPDHYIVFNNLEVPARDGFPKREIDLLVLARSGIFVIEVKHLRGEIRGAEANPTWVQIKQSHLGQRYENSFRNPVKQVNGAAKALRMHLRSFGLETWVESIVVFTHPDGVLRRTPGSTAVVDLEQLAQTILNHRPGRPVRDFTRVLEVLKGLRIDPPVEDVDGPRHMSVFMRDFVTAHDRVHGTMAIDLSKLHGSSGVETDIPKDPEPREVRPAVSVVPVATPIPLVVNALSSNGEIVEVTIREQRTRWFVRR